VRASRPWAVGKRHLARRPPPPSPTLLPLHPLPQIHLRLPDLPSAVDAVASPPFIQPHPASGASPHPHHLSRQPLSQRTVQRLVASERVPFIRVGRSVRFRQPSLVAWLASAEPSIQVRAETSKSKRSRVIPLRKDLVAVLRRQLQRKPARKAKAERPLALYRKRLREAETDESIRLAERHLRVATRAVEAADCVVFTNSVGGRWRKELCRRLEPCLKSAGLSTDLDVHTLRHTFGSHLIAAGWDVKTVQELMGHSSATVTLDVYAHAFEDRKRDAVQAVPIPIEDSADGARRTRAEGG